MSTVSSNHTVARHKLDREYSKQRNISRIERSTGLWWQPVATIQWNYALQ